MSRAKVPAGSTNAAGSVPVIAALSVCELTTAYDLGVSSNPVKHTLVREADARTACSSNWCVTYLRWRRGWRRRVAWNQCLIRCQKPSPVLPAKVGDPRRWMAVPLAGTAGAVTGKAYTLW